VRVSFAGELGWEMHCPADAPAIWDAVTAAGAKPFGMFALNSLRIEKGYRAWKGDLSTDYTLLQGGLDRFIDWSKDFPGKAALLAERQAGVTKRFVTLTVEAGDATRPTCRPSGTTAQVWARRPRRWGYRVGASVALACCAPISPPGTGQVEVGGRDLWGRSVWDPQRKCARARMARRKPGPAPMNAPEDTRMSKITLLDGGMGQELVHRSGDSPTPLWSTQVMIDHPGLVQAVHADYFAAGATIATTNTYAMHHDRLAGTGVGGAFDAAHDARAG
jgi:hypothetical protein